MSYNSNDYLTRETNFQSESDSISLKTNYNSILCYKYAENNLNQGPKSEIDLKCKSALSIKNLRSTKSSNKNLTIIVSKDVINNEVYVSNLEKKIRLESFSDNQFVSSNLNEKEKYKESCNYFDSSLQYDEDVITKIQVQKDNFAYEFYDDNNDIEDKSPHENQLGISSNLNSNLKSFTKLKNNIDNTNEFTIINKGEISFRKQTSIAKSKRCSISVNLCTNNNLNSVKLEKSNELKVNFNNYININIDNKEINNTNSKDDNSNKCKKSKKIENCNSDRIQCSCTVF